jgi:hypothetical protein
MNSVERRRLEKEYGVEKARKIERTKKIKRVMIVVSVVSFAGGTIFRLGGMFAKGLAQEKQVESSCQDELLTLRQNEKAYQVILEKEPNNNNALDGLREIQSRITEVQKDCQE